MKFYKHLESQNTVVVMNPLGNGDSCPEGMEELIPKTADATTEKHVPLVKSEDNKVTVTVGSTIHPMLEKHYIEWIVLETNKSFKKVSFKPEENPEAVFILSEGEKPLRAYEFCNLHGLWSAEI